MKNIHILPTDKPSRLLINKENSLVLTSNYYSSSKPQNIYITSDEEIKSNCWVLNIVNGSIYKTYNGRNFQEDKENEKWRKIILTTDQDLIKDGVQVIDDEFLEWFVKNPSCEEVEVKDVYKTFLEGDKRSVSNFRNRYKIIIPKEEPKQETLEEVAERLTKDFPHYSVMGNMDDSDIKGWFLEALQKGAKWQQERSYSEEEVFKLLSESRMYGQLINAIGITKWFKQFKKK